MSTGNRLPITYERPTVIIPPGTFYYKFIRRLESADTNPSSFYPGHPIFHLYKQIRSGGITAEQRYDDNEYWQPVPSLPFIIYENGDEETLATTEDISRSLRNDTKKEKATSVDFPPYFHAYYGGKVYIATNKFADVFGDKNQKNNPYTYRYLRLWTLHPEDDKYDYVDSSGDRKISYFYAVPTAKTPSSQYGLKFYAIKQEILDSFTSSGSQIQIGEELYTETQGEQGDLSESGLITQYITSNIVRESIKSAMFTYLTVDLKKSPEAAAKQINSFEASIEKQATKTGASGVKGPYDNGQPRSAVTIVRGTFGGRSGYSAPIVTGSENRPQIVQQYRVPNTAQPVTRRHVFQFKPNQINYSGIGSDWTEIPRSSKLPMIDWRSYKLLQVSFQFLVAPDDDGSLDDLRDEKIIKKPIDAQLRELRQMAIAPYPVYLLGFDEILSQQMRFPFEGGRGVEFVISEFNISSLLRTDDGKINRAQCDITLREIPIESVRLIEFPTLRFGKQIPISSKERGNTGEGSNNSYTETLG